MLSFIPGGLYVERRGGNFVWLVGWTAVLSRTSYLLIGLLPFFLPASYIPMAVVAVWSLATIPNSIFMPAWTAVMQKAISPRLRGQLNGTRWGLLSVVSAIAITVFGYLLDRVPFPRGYQIVFAISFAAAVLHSYFWVKVKSPPFVPVRAPSSQGVTFGQRLRTFLRPFAESRPFVRYILATLVYRLMINMPVALFSIFWVRDLDASNTMIGLRGTAGYVALVFGYGFWGSMANRLGHRNMLLIGGYLLGFYPLLTSQAPSMEWLIPIAVIWGFNAAAIDIGFFDTLLAVCPEGRQPTFAAAANMLASIVAFVAPLIGAGLASLFEVRTTLLIIGIVQIASATLFLLLPSREQEGLDASG
jgi:MFS family permease